MVIARRSLAVMVVLLFALCSLGCRRGVEDAPRKAFQVPCLLPRFPAEIDRFPAPCLFPAATTAVADLPCSIQTYHQRENEPQVRLLLEYDSSGRVISELSDPVGRFPSSSKYKYEQNSDALTVRKAKWFCDQEPAFTDDLAITYRFDQKQHLVAVESPGSSLHLSYEAPSSFFSSSTLVTITGGSEPMSFAINRRGEIIARNRSGADFPTNIDYDHDDGRVSSFVERARGALRVNEARITYDHGRPTKMVWTHYSNYQSETNRTEFAYECARFPTCLKAEGDQQSESARTAPAKAQDSKQAAAPEVPKKSVEGARWAADVQRRVQGLRSGTSKPVLKWDSRLSASAQQLAEDRAHGITAFNPKLLNMLGYQYPVRVEKVGQLTDGPPEADLGRFSELDTWDAMANRDLGVGLDRIEPGLPNAGKLVMIVVSAQRSH